MIKLSYADMKSHFINLLFINLFYKRNILSICLWSN